MAVPKVDKKLLEQLEEMGFSLARSIRSLHYSGNTSLEDAMNWIVEHENDSDIDEIPLVPMDINLDATKPFPITEEVKIKAQNLRIGANQLSKRKEKELEREGEKERIQAGKRIMEAKKTAEENARKRMIALREAEKEEESKAREKIRQKFEADKAERRSRLGISPAATSSVQSASTASHMPVTSTKKVELLCDCLRSLRRYHKDEDARVKKAFQILPIYIRNVVKNPDVEKYRKIRLSNPIFQESVGSLIGGVRFLELCGFERTNRGQFLYLPREKVDMVTLNSALSALHSAITNPFFGLLSVDSVELP
ncbi:UBX domain-containing protein 1-like isoform X2 [Chenopodium quinoa]|uniref:UBX domain-containing protein 1-like isoform X2 n=1 Tax=Chenopodium quinoa TaxID=63459 RepID=UPI000B7739BE|nr:UBX domain-containing protein 1-like isoform X2 [Chenopodium quinoa]